MDSQIPVLNKDFFSDILAQIKTFFQDLNQIRKKTVLSLYAKQITNKTKIKDSFPFALYASPVVLQLFLYRV